MDVVSPLSLLEVTMGEENNADDDCIIIDDDDDTHGDTQGSVAKMEVEVDPLFVAPSVVYNDKLNDMPTLWVTTNITNLAGVTQAEEAFRKSQYSNTYEVLMEILHCTICRDHVGCDARIHPSSIEHPVLRVLICEHCVCMYKTVNFIMNDKGKEINCRWCGKTSANEIVLRTCQQCPFSFCEVCLKNNCPDYLKNEPRFPWTCVVCNLQVLWPVRATFWALHCLKSLLLANPGNSLAKINGDISLCCKYRKKKKKKVVDALQTLGRLETFDWNQIVPPHLLNGSTEVDFYQTNVSEIDFSNSIESYPNPPKRVVKSRAKPKPRSKTKPKPKSKTSAACTQSSSVSIPTVVSPQLNHKILTNRSDNEKPHWLKQKIIGYMNDFDQLKKKLEDIEKSLDFDENDPRTEENVDSITTLLSLHRELLNSCRLSLINEWKERKARLLLEKYNANTEVAEIKNEAVSPDVQEKMATNKMLKSNNRNKSNNKVNLISNMKYSNFNNTCHPIKDCFVKLKRLEMPMDILVKKEEGYI